MCETDKSITYSPKLFRQPPLLCAVHCWVGQSRKRTRRFNLIRTSLLSSLSSFHYCVVVSWYNGLISLQLLHFKSFGSTFPNCERTCWMWWHAKNLMEILDSHVISLPLPPCSTRRALDNNVLPINELAGRSFSRKFLGIDADSHTEHRRKSRNSATCIIADYKRIENLACVRQTSR